MEPAEIVHARARHTALSLLLLLAAGPLSGQNAREKVQLLSAKSAQLLEVDGQPFRKVVGPARFFHNNTYLLCDTALWNVNTGIIDAVGHVRIIQGDTQLSSETLQYVVEEDLARFRGSLVQLEDGDKNTLRTRWLDYNTRDSVAIFQNGAAMRDKDGQVIESLYGSYDSRAQLFVFNDNVNMYMDTTFVKTSRLEYRSDLSTAWFGYGTDMWQDDKMLSANSGWYRRPEELFLFHDNVHVLTQQQESWSDSLYYHRAAGDAQMLGHVELMDTTRNVYALAGEFCYADSLRQVRMTREPAIMSIEEDRYGRRDTLYMGADVLLFRTIRRCDIPEAWEKDAQKRLSDISGDPVMEYRKKAAEAAAKARQEQAEKDGTANRPGPKKPAPSPRKAEPEAEDTVAAVAADTTLPALTDTLPPAPDTTGIAFLWGSKHVRLFRKDMQMSGDSLTYTDLDSLVRMYQEPIFYNEGNRQYAADSIYAVIRDKRMQKAHLLSNAFITIQEDSISYDQIRGAEMVAYFDSTSALVRFDALGGASSLFFLEENGALATANKVDAKMIYATFAAGKMERIFYYDNPKNDGYPSVQLPQEERQLKGFRWEPERRPASPKDVTSLVPRRSERSAYLSRPHTEFTQTNLYFPGYIKQVYREIAIRDSLAVVREREAAAARAAEKKAREEEQKDTLVTAPAVLPAPADTLKTAPADTTGTLAAPADTLTAKPALTPAQQKKLEREARKAQRDADREARWAELDRRDAERKAAREAKKLQRERERKLRALRKREKRAQRERALLEKYLNRYRQKQKH